MILNQMYLSMIHFTTQFQNVPEMAFYSFFPFLQLFGRRPELKSINFKNIGIDIAIHESIIQTILFSHFFAFA